jgi:hypothetical protein
MPCPRWRKASFVLRPLALAAALAVSVFAAGTGARQQPTLVDTSTIGPQVGTAVPQFSGTDQFGVTHTLESSLGAKGAMIVFFRSSDW